MFIYLCILYYQSKSIYLSIQSSSNNPRFFFYTNLTWVAPVAGRLCGFCFAIVPKITQDQETEEMFWIMCWKKEGQMKIFLQFFFNIHLAFL